MSVEGTYPNSSIQLLPELQVKLIVDNIKPHLHVDAGGFLNEVEIIDVFSGRSRVEHVRSLFSVLKTKDNAAFGSFCLVLSNSGYGHWSKALMDEAGLDHDFKGTPQLEKAVVDAILCKRRMMFRLPFKNICSSFNECRDKLLSILEDLPPKDFKMFMISFNDGLRAIKKNASLEQSIMESQPLDVFTALSSQKMYTQFDLEIFDLMAECLPKGISKNFKAALDTYKGNELCPLLEETLSALAGDAEVVSTHDDQKKQLSLAFVVPGDARFGILMEARRYLEEEMEIHDVSNMRFDFNCITVLFDIAYPPGDIEELAKRFLSDKHLQEMKKLDILEVFLLSHWAVGVSDGSICYFNEVPIQPDIVPSAGVIERKNPPIQTEDFQSEMFMERYRKKFLEVVDANAISMKLELERVIPKNLFFDMDKTSPDEATKMLYLHLHANATSNDIHKLCDAMTRTSGHGNMNKLGAKMKSDEDLPPNRSLQRADMEY